MSSPEAEIEDMKPEEEQESSSLELVTEESPTELKEEEEGEEEMFIFDINRPELIDAMIQAADTLESVSKGIKPISEAILFYDVELPKVLSESRKLVKRRTRKREKKASS